MTAGQSKSSPRRSFGRHSPPDAFHDPVQAEKEAGSFLKGRCPVDCSTRQPYKAYSSDQSLRPLLSSRKTLSEREYLPEWPGVSVFKQNTR